jgi:hypothetical protein
MRDAQGNSKRERSMTRILASVSGGVTGSRQSWVKSNGEIREFDTLAEAKRVAAELNATMKGPAGVSIRYEAIESDEL